MEREILSQNLYSVLTDEPVRREELKAILGTSDREMRKAVKYLREDGIGVCSSSSHEKHGYWLGNPKEVRNTIREQRERAVELSITADAMEYNLPMDTIVTEERNDIMENRIEKMLLNYGKMMQTLLRRHAGENAEFSINLTQEKVEIERKN